LGWWEGEWQAKSLAVLRIAHRGVGNMPFRRF